MEKEKTGKGKNIVIVILILIILGLTGYIVYDKLVTDKKTVQKQEQTKKAQSQKVNIISQGEAIMVGKDLYKKSRDLSNWQFELFNNGSTDNKTDQKNYKIENGIATEMPEGEYSKIYTKFNDTISKNIKDLFTTNGLNQFLNYQTSKNNSFIVKDNNDNFYLQKNVGGRLGYHVIDDFDIQVNKIEENSVTFTVSDYWFEVGSDESDYSKSSPDAAKIDNTFKIAKENDAWKVEDYTDSFEAYIKLLNSNN